MTKRILILRWGGSAYDSLGGLLELTARQFNELGANVGIFVADGPNWLNQLYGILQQGDIAFALTMSGIGVEAMIDGKSMWETAKVPLFNWCCDHPCYFPVRHAIRSPYLLHGYVFPDHAKYNVAHFRANGVAYSAHLGIPPRSVFPHAPMPASSRNGRIIFTKTGRDTNEIEARWRNTGNDIGQILFHAAEELMLGSTGDFLPVIQRVAEPFGLFFTGSSHLAMQLIAEVDAYVRFRRANLIARSILAYPVDVFGTGWDHIPWEGARARYGGPLSWRAMLELLPGYSACLSTNPLVDDSVHDRVFYALAAGVPPIGDSNRFTRTHMPGLEPYMFTFKPESVGQAIEAVLLDPETSASHTEEAWQALSMPFGLRRSAQQIVQFVSLHNLNASFGS